MITAKEARLLSEKNLVLSKELDEVEKKIREVASFGKKDLIYKPRVTLDKDAFLNLSKLLTEAGFVVAWVNNQDKLIIKW